MATPNNFNARDIIDFLSQETEVANVLNGEAMVDRIKEEFKNQSEEGKKAAERMAENLRNSGNNISAQLQEIEREASKAGYNVFFSYNKGRKQIDIKMERRAGMRGDKNVPATKINPVNFKIDVGSAKAGYNNGVPSTKSLSIQQKDDFTYFATATEDMLRGIRETLVEINRGGKGENRSTAAANSMMKDAVKKANKGLVSHTNHASVNDEYFDDDRYEGDSIRRQLFMQTNAKMAGVIDSVMKKLKGKRQKIKTEDGLDIDDSQLQRDILIYIEAAQKKTLGKKTADKILEGRGYSKEDIKNLAEAIGKDLLAIENTVNLGSDRSMATLTESYMGARDTLLGNYGRSDRHPSQGRNTVKKINGSERRKTAFREVDLQSKGYYDSAEHDVYTSAQIGAKDIQGAYLAVKKNAEDSLRESLVEQNKNRKKKWSKNKIERKIQSELKRQGYIDFDPSVDDDMMIARESSLGDLTGTRERSTQLSKEEYDKYVDDATKKVNDIINDNKKKSKKIKFGKNTYDLKDEAQKQEYIQKYIMTRAISGLKPNEIYGNVSINPFTDEDGKEMFSLSTQQLVGGGQQEKVVTGGIGERNYAFALNNNIFDKVVEQLKNDKVLPKNFDVKSLDFIREKGDFKSNEMGQLAISRLGHLFGKTKDKKGFVDALKKSPLGSFITGLTKDGSGIEFSESDEAMNAFVNNGDGGLTSLYNWMSETDLSALGIDENGKVFDKNARAFIYETEAGLADVFKWTKRVQTGKKEREAQMRTAAVSGSSSSYTKQLQERYKGSNAKDRKIIEKAEHDIAEIESAIFEKTSSTASWDDKKVSDFIKTKSFKKGSFLEKGIKDTTKTAITMGVGDQYSINTEKYKDIIAEYQRGHISEEDFMKTWEGEAEAIRQEMIASGIDPSQIETIIDPGQIFGFSAFGDQYQGRLLHLGNTSPDSMTDPVTGETVYNRSEYASGVNSLFKAMGSKAKNKKSKVSEAAANVTLGMFGTASTHHGALNERANKRRLGHSASFKTSGITPEQIEGLTGDQKDRYIDSGFISESAMKSLLRDTYDYEREDGTTIDEGKYLEALYAQYAESDKFKNGKKKAISFDDKRWGETFEDKRNNLIKEIMSIAETEGLRGMFNRFPSIDSEAVKNSRLFVSKDIKDKETMKVGSGLAKAINADFDGDTINVILKMLSDYSGDKTEDWDRDVMQRVYKMRGGKKASKTDEERQKSYETALSGADDAFLKEISGLAAKVNNQYIGNFSNMSTSIRNALGETEYDETRAVYTDGKMNQSSFEKIAKGLVVKAVGQTLEQDAISAKKVEQRIVEEISKAQEKKEKELRRKLDPKNQEDAKILKDLRSDIASNVTNDFENLSKKIRDGGFESDSEFIKALGDLGITKDGKVDSLGMTTAMAQIQKMAEMNGIDKSVVSKIFGGIDITSDTFDGKLDTNVVSSILKSTSKDLYGDKKGFFYRGDQFNPAVATARSNNVGSKGDSYEVIRRMKSNGFGDNLLEIEEANVLFNERGEILRAVADAYKYEIGMEEKKIGVALREADAIRKAGKSWKDYSDLISKKYKLDEEAEKVAGKGDFYVASNKVLSEGGFTRTTPSAIKNILNPRTDGTTGLDKSVLDDRVAKGLFKPKKGELVKAFGVDSEKTLMSLFGTSQSIIGGNLAHAIAQGDKAGAKEFETELKNLLSVFGKSTKEIETVISAFQKAGTNMSAIADNFGTTVGNELPIAGVSTDGNYLINGRMDTLRYQQRQNQYTGKMDDVYTILDYKTRVGTGIKHDDVAQVIMYQEMFKDMQKTWMTDERFKGMSDKDLLDVARVDIAKSLSGGERSKEAIDNLVNSLTEEDINRIRNGARIESGVVVGDSRSGASQAYKISGSITGDIKDMVMGGDWEKLSPDQIATLLSMQQKITSPDFYKEGNYVASKKEPEKPKTKDDKETEKKKNQEDFIKLLEKEYKLRLEIERLKNEQRSVKQFVLDSQPGSDPFKNTDEWTLYDKKIKSAENRLKTAENERIDAGKKLKGKKNKEFKDNEIDIKEGVLSSEKESLRKSREEEILSLIQQEYDLRLKINKIEIDNILESGGKNPEANVAMFAKTGLLIKDSREINSRRRNLSSDFVGDDRKYIDDAIASKEYELKKKKEEYATKALNSALKEEYQLKLKIAELRVKKELSTDEKEKENIDKLISYKSLNLTKTEETRKSLEDRVTDKDYKNSVLSEEEAKYQLELQKLAENAAKGTSNIVGKNSLFSDLKKQFKGYLVNMFSIYRIMGKITQSIRKVINITKELDKAVTNIRIVTGMTSEETDTLMMKYSSMARALGVTTQAIAQAGAEWMRQGYSAEEANSLIESSTKLSKLGMMDMNNATKVLTSTMKGFKLEASDVGKVVDKLTKLDMNYATTASDIGEAMSRTAAIANQMGVSLDDTAAMVTTIMDVTQQSAEMTGTAIRTILSRYGNVKAGSFVSMLTDGEDLENINDIEKVLSVLGIEIRKSGLEMRDVGEVLDELAIKWKSLSDVEKNAVATAFAGTRQRNQFIVLMDGWDQVKEASKMAAESTGTADEKYGAYMDSIEARLNKLQTAWEEFTQKLGSSKLVKGALSAITLLVENLDKLLNIATSLVALNLGKKIFSLSKMKFSFSTIGFQRGTKDMMTTGSQSGGIISRIFGTTQKGFADVSSKMTQIMNIMQTGQPGGVVTSAPTVVNSKTVGERAVLYQQNKKTIEANKSSINSLRNNINKANKNIELGIDKNNNFKVATKSQLRMDNKIAQNNMLYAQNAVLKGKGYDVGGATITKTKGEYYSTKMVDGNVQTTKLDANSPEVKQAKQMQKQQTGQKLGGAAMMGIMSASTWDTGSMNDTGKSLGFSYGSGKTTIDDVENTEAEDFLYKTSHGIGSAALSMIPFVGPIVSAVFGPMLSDLFHGLIKWGVHAEEINRKERVRVAKENLEALKKIEDATIGVENAIFNINDAQSMSAAKESVDKLINTLLDDGKNRQRVMNELGGKFGFAVDKLGNTTMTTADLEKILLYGTDKEKAIATNTINQVTNSESAVEKYKSQEEDRHKNDGSLKSAIDKTADTVSTGMFSNDTSMKGAIMDSLGLYSKEVIANASSNNNVSYKTKRTIVGDTADDKEKNIEAAIIEMRKIVEAGEFKGNTLTKSVKDEINSEIKSLESALKDVKDYNAKTEKLNKELNELELEEAFRSSGLSMWNAVDIANTSLETVIQTFANDLELTGVATRDATGMITEEARQQIETYLRSNEQFSSLFNTGAQTLNEMVSNVSKQNELVSKTGAKSFDELKDAFDRADAEKITKFSDAAGIAAEELMNLVYKADSSQLSSFARALNMTTEEVLALQDKLGSITLSDLIKTPAETREAFNELVGIFSEISTKGSATGETLEKLNSNYFKLYNKYDEFGNVISTGSENLLENLRERLFGNANSSGTQAFLYQNATFQNLKGNSDMYKSYLSSLENSDVWNSLSNDQRAMFTGANSLADVIHLFNSNNANGKDLQNTLSSFLDSLNLNNDYYTELQNRLVEWQKHDNQMTIDGLQGQIDALDEINEEREREIELIKAKDALENAKKEKKRVYRAGVGWTYEADQEKIKEARDRLDEVERETDKENLQYQIDLLEKQNSMLDNMSKNEELKALKATFDEYNTYMKNKFGKDITNGFSAIIDLAESDRDMTWSTYVENMGTEQAVGEQADITNMINQANDIAYLDSVLAGMTAGKEGKELEKTLHSEEYLSKQTARKNAYNSFVGSVSNLKASGVDDNTINEYLQSGLDSKYQNDSNYNSTSSYTAAKYDGEIDDEYYYLKSGFGTSAGQTSVQKYDEPNKYLKLKPAGTYSSSDMSAAMKLLSEEPDKVRVDYYDENDKAWKMLPDDASIINSLPSGTIIHAGTDKVNSSTDPGYGYAIKDGASWENMTASVETFAKGTFGLDKAVMAMINELGTEGIVTPQGTLTALPSKTGIVPADLTKNLYDLGEVAPNLIKRLSFGQTLHTNNSSNVEDNSMSVENLYATFEADEGFDFEKLLVSARQYIKNTKGTR